MREDAALVQHGDLLSRLAFGQRSDELHVVFHHHQRMAALEREEQLGRALGLFDAGCCT